MRERNESFNDVGRINVKLLQNRINCEENIEGKEKDRISALPDSILIKILSILPYTKYAIRTGTLSKRWQHLWSFIHNLVFERHDQNDSPSDFFSFVGKTLSQCRQLKLYKFELRSGRGYDIQFELQVNNWIRYAVSCNVEELILELQYNSVKDEFVLDEFFYTNSCITDMTLAGCILNPTGATSWKKLKSLCIVRGNLDEDLIENILSGSSQLETLELRCSSGYRRLNITSKSVKNLILCGYLANWETQYVIEINAPSILSLKICYQVFLQKILLLNVSSLVKADLDYWNEFLDNTTIYEMFSELILNLQHVEELKIGISCFKQFFHLEATGFTFPSNLKVFDSLEQVADWYEWSSDDDGDVDSIENGHWTELE